MIKAYYWYNSFVSDPIRSTVGLSSTRLQPFKHRRVQRKRAAAGVVRRRHSGAKKVWRRFIERHFLSIRRLETARAKVSQPVFRLVWCEETNKTRASKESRSKVYEEKTFEKKNAESDSFWGNEDRDVPVARAVSLCPRTVSWPRLAIESATSS